eukprot:968957-Pyramimonas_sp.AAC.1
MHTSAAPRAARPAAWCEHLRSAYSRDQRGLLYVYVLLSLLNVLPAGALSQGFGTVERRLKMGKLSRGKGVQNSWGR